MFASPVTNKRETLSLSPGLYYEMLVLSTPARICAVALKDTLCHVVCQVAPFTEREAADAGISTIPGVISLEVTEPHFAVRHRGLDICHILKGTFEQFLVIISVSCSLS
jgi:hypothetical protein